MLFWMIVKVSLKSLIANKLRSVLAMLGIIIGVAAVIAMLAIGAGAKQTVLSRVTAMGSNLLIVRPGQKGTGGVMTSTQQNLTIDDGLAIAKTIGKVSSVSPVAGGSYQVKFLNQNTRTSVTGVAPTYLAIRDFPLERGKPFSDADCDRWARVALIGSLTATNLFGASDPLGQTIKIKDIPFKVIGILKSKGDQVWFNPDDQVLVPFTTAMHLLIGQTYLREIDVQAVDGADLTPIQNDMSALLRKRHKVQPDAPDDVNIQNQAELLSTMNTVIGTFTVLLAGVAGISLAVGGIGIMNIMLVTVTERTREIGLRKAIGARDNDILTQFLFESVLMSGVGGLIGVGIGMGLAHIVTLFNLQPLVQLSSVVLSMSFACGVGIFFGFYPALRASRLDPIEALRYE